MEQTLCAMGSSIGSIRRNSICTTAFWWSPDSKSIAYLQFDTHDEPLYPHEDLLRLRAVYEPERYPQAGDNNAAIRLGVVSLAGGPTRWYDVGDTRQSYLIARAGWMPGSRALYVLRFNRVQNRDALFSIDVESGSRATIFEESDPYWINLKGDIWFLDNGKQFLWTSERTPGGYRHLFLYSNDGRQVDQLTSGAWEVTGIVAWMRPAAAFTTLPMNRTTSSSTFTHRPGRPEQAPPQPGTRQPCHLDGARRPLLPGHLVEPQRAAGAAYSMRATVQNSASIASRTAAP